MVYFNFIFGYSIREAASPLNHKHETVSKTINLKVVNSMSRKAKRSKVSQAAATLGKKSSSPAQKKRASATLRNAQDDE